MEAGSGGENETPCGARASDVESAYGWILVHHKHTINNRWPGPASLMSSTTMLRFSARAELVLKPNQLARSPPLR